jgi:hypothetical protein
MPATEQHGYQVDTFCTRTAAKDTSQTKTKQNIDSNGKRQYIDLLSAPLRPSV